MTVHTDCLVVVNGPEDGTEFPIVRAPFDVGRAPGCAAYVTLDVAVRPEHARVWAVSDGYRVRRTTGCAVYVDGRRTGRFRSRILRSGGTVQVGHTLLALQCAPDGLASRSRGLVMHSDMACLLHWILGCALGVAWTLPHGVSKLFRFIKGHKSLLVVALVAAYFFWPPCHNFVNAAARTASFWITNFLSRLSFP